mmetsp:Transcript_49994/g.88027  ORF Transcript_49994/g.88027 Transcript_49994/m.88027 type:complete len:380 (-) Transcript_49994:323-1462(-)
MGCCGSKEQKVEKDSGDKTLDDCEMEEIGVGVYDDAFSKVSAPLQQLVDQNNYFVGALDAVQNTAAAICGAYLTELKTNGKLSFEIIKPPKEKEENITVLIASGGKGVDIKDQKLYDQMFGPQNRFGQAMPGLIDICNKALDPLNKAVSESSLKIEVKYNRVIVVKGDKKDGESKEVAAKNATAQYAIDSFNSVYFPMKLNLCKAAFEGGLKDACNEVVENIKKHVKDAIPKVNVDLAKLVEGELVFDISMGEIDFDVLPTMVHKAWDNIMGPEGLIAIMKLAAKALAEVKAQLEEAKKAIEALPTDPKEIINKAKESGMSPFAAMKVPKKIKGNMAQFARGPNISQSFVDLLKSTCDEVSQGFKGGLKDSGVKDGTRT